MKDIWCANGKNDGPNMMEMTLLRIALPLNNQPLWMLAFSFSFFSKGYSTFHQFFIVCYMNWERWKSWTMDENETSLERSIEKINFRWYAG
jgi:hypothetical protein